MLDVTLERKIQAELDQLDHGLFLDKEWSPFGYVYYSVKMSLKDTHPVTVLDWRAGNHPLPLSMDIVNKVRNQEGSIMEALKTVTVNNAVRKEKARQEALQEVDDRTHEWEFEKRGDRKIYDLESPYGS